MVTSGVSNHGGDVHTAGGLTRRSLFALGAGLAGAGTALGALACARPGAERAPQQDRLSALKNASLECWVHADTRSAWQKLALEDYNKEKGYNVQVNWIRLSSTSEVAEKLVVTIAAGSGFPDMADVEISQMGRLLKTPSPPLVAYNDYLKGKENDFFKPSFVDPWSLDGKYYGLGNELNVCLFAYRHDLFAQVGIKTPIETWDDLIEAGKIISSICPEGMFFVRTGTTGTFHMLAIQNGGGFLEQGRKLIINHPANLRTLEFLVDLIYRHRAASLIPSGRPGGDPGNMIFKDAMNTGKVAAELGPTWRISGGMRVDAPDTEGKWMVQHLPQWSRSGPKRTTSWGGTGMTVLAEGKYRDIAVDFVVWEHSTKAVLHDFDLRQVWPTYKKVYDDPRLSEPVPWFNNQRVGVLMREAAETMLPFYQRVWWPEISNGASKHITAALRNEVSPRQAIEQAHRDAKAEIEAAGGRIEG